MSLLDEYNACYLPVVAARDSLVPPEIPPGFDPLNPDLSNPIFSNYVNDLAAHESKISDINNIILPNIQKVYDDASASLSSYYGNITSNLGKKIAGNATMPEYAATVADACSFIKDLRDGAIFARIKAYVAKIAMDGISSVIDSLKSEVLAAVSDLGLFDAISAMDNLANDVNKALGTCVGLLGQGTAFLTGISNCLGDVGLLDSKLGAGVTEIKNLMAAGGGQITNMQSAISSITDKIKSSADISGQATALTDKLKSASYKTLAGI